MEYLQSLFCFHQIVKFGFSYKKNIIHVTPFFQKVDMCGLSLEVRSLSYDSGPLLIMGWSSEQRVLFICVLMVSMKMNIKYNLYINIFKFTCSKCLFMLIYWLSNSESGIVVNRLYNKHNAELRGPLRAHIFQKVCFYEQKYDFWLVRVPFDLLNTPP